MDTPQELYYDSVEEQYLQECAKFKKGDVVYFEYTDEKDENNPNHTSVSIGVITKASVKKQLRNFSKKEYVSTIICYDIVSPINLYEDVSECKITSASEFIYREYIYNAAQ